MCSWGAFLEEVSLSRNLKTEKKPGIWGWEQGSTSGKAADLKSLWRWEGKHDQDTVQVASKTYSEYHGACALSEPGKSLLLLFNLYYMNEVSLLIVFSFVPGVHGSWENTLGESPWFKDTKEEMTLMLLWSHTAVARASVSGLQWTRAASPVWGPPLCKNLESETS